MYPTLHLTCTFCGTSGSEWHFRYRGDIYCRSCFKDYFELLECSKCHKKKYIHYKTKPTPICKICLIKDAPCIRCKRPVTSFGKITKHGQVCSACSRYFQELRECDKCGSLVLDVYNRNLNGETANLCQKCYSKLLPSCHYCHRKKRDCTLDENGKMICAACKGVPRICNQCGKSFPAGRGRICRECSSTNGLLKKVAFAKGALSHQMGGYFHSFSSYLKAKKGAPFASYRILYFFSFFQELDALMEKIGTFPSYEEIIREMSVAHTRRYLAAMHFFEEEKIIYRDKSMQDLYANFDMIERYVKTFYGRDPRYHDLIQDYYTYLDTRQMEGKMSVRSVRLALTPAVKFLEYCLFLDREDLTQEILNGFLWCFPGQKNSLSSFIVFLRKQKGHTLQMPGKGFRIALTRPTSSKAMRKQRFIQMLRDISHQKETERDSRLTRENVLRIAIEYLHNIKIPEGEIMLSFLPTKKRGEGFIIRFAGEEVYLPAELR